MTADLSDFASDLRALCSSMRRVADATERLSRVLAADAGAREAVGRAPDDGGGWVKPSIPAVVDRFAAYYRKHQAWGSLHIVLADGNEGDRSVEFCLYSAEESGDVEGATLARILLRMSKTQRLKLYNMDWR